MDWNNETTWHLLSPSVVPASHGNRPICHATRTAPALRNASAANGSQPAVVVPAPSLTPATQDPPDAHSQIPPAPLRLSRRIPSFPLIVTPDVMDERTSPTYWSHKRHRTGEDFLAVDLSIREASLKNFGSFSLAFSAAVQPRVERFGDQRGFIAFGRRSGRTFVLGDPLASDRDKESLIDDFLRQFPSPSFIQIHAKTARLLQDRGFFVNEMGIDTRLNLDEFSFSGKAREWLRYADNWVTRRHFEIREFHIREHRGQVEEISEAWRATRTVRRKEVRFLNRPIVMEDEPNVRRFGLFDPGGRLDAYLFFDPLFHQGEIIGYVTCIKRRRPTCNGYVETAIMKRAIESFQTEGVPSLWLGLSPFAKIRNADFHHNRLLHHATRYLYDAGWFNRLLYNFRGHSEYKNRYQGEEHKVYHASRARFNTYRLISFASLCGVF